MRHIDLATLLAKIFADDAGRKVKKRLHRAHTKLAQMHAAARHAHAVKNGPNKWKPVRDLEISVLGNKCWYTEVELVGAPLVVDHYRPACKYWWLTYDATNFRVSCAWVNSPKENSLYGCAGGKGDQFPLLDPGFRARGRNNLRIEKPVLLDPCSAADCSLLAFLSDGRPVINPGFAGHPDAARRVEESKILLNLDHPDFNSKREQLCNAIGDDVRLHEALPLSSPERGVIRARLEAALALNAAFSTAARFYLQLHRHLNWVEAMLDIR